MRSYPTNSPQGAARIVALTMLADGHLAKSELDVIERQGAHEQLGLDLETMQSVLHGFCEDLLHSAHLTWSDVPEDTRSFVLTCIDVDAPTVGDDVIVQAEDHVAEGETIVLGAAVEHWGLHREMFESA